jgi:hypothetical protein
MVVVGRLRPYLRRKRMLIKWRNLQVFDMKVAMLARGGVHEVTLQPVFSLMFTPSTCFKASKIPRMIKVL